MGYRSFYSGSTGSSYACPNLVGGDELVLPLELGRMGDRLLHAYEPDLETATDAQKETKA